MKKYLIILAIVTATFTIFEFYYQPPLTFRNGTGWDGYFYHLAAKQWQMGEIPTTRAPFVTRIGTGILAVLLSPNDLILGFKALNLTASLLNVFLIFFFVRIHFNNKIAFWSAIYFLFHWMGPRFILHYPVITDPISFTFIFSSLILISKERKFNLIYLMALSAIGMVFKEIMIIVPITYFLVKSNINIDFKNYKITAKPYYWGLLPIVLCLLVQNFIKMNVIDTDNFNYARKAYAMFYEKQYMKYLQSWFHIFGLLFSLAIFYFKATLGYLKENKLILYFSLLIIFMSLVGGADWEKFISTGMIALTPILLKVFFEKLKGLNFIKIFIIITLILTTRLPFVLPDYIYPGITTITFLTPLGNEFDYLDLWASHGSKITEGLIFLQYLVTSVVLWLWLIFFSKK